MNLNQLLKIVKEHDSSTISKSDFQDIYDVVEQIFSQINIEAKLKFPDDSGLQNVVRLVRMEHLFRDLAVELMMQKSSQISTNELVCKLLKQK